MEWLYNSNTLYQKALPREKWPDIELFLHSLLRKHIESGRVNISQFLRMYRKKRNGRMFPARGFQKKVVGQ